MKGIIVEKDGTIRLADDIPMQNQDHMKHWSK